MEMLLGLCRILVTAVLLVSASDYGRQADAKEGQEAQTSGARKPSSGQLPSSQEIAEAKAKGLVWVNTATRVYHKEGPMYGTTSHGRFMSEEDAKRAGYRIAKKTGTAKTTASGK